MKVALYARVSSCDQNTENQLLELRRYVEARGWTAVEYVDQGVSGAKDRRPALDQLVRDVRRHRVQGVVCWRLDRLGRNLRHLVLLLDEWQSRGVAFVTLGEGIDTSTPAGRLVAGVLGSIAGVRAGAHSGAHSRGPCACLGARQAPRAAPIACDAGSGHLRGPLPCGCRSALGGVRRHNQAVAPHWPGGRVRIPADWGLSFAPLLAIRLMEGE